MDNINIEMRRLLSTPLSYGYLKNFKKPVVEMPATKPPKYIYEVGYHPSSIPDLDMKFKDHAHMNDWNMIVFGEEDKYEFQYSGQWWEAITVSNRLMFIALTFFLYFGWASAAEERKAKNLPGVNSFYRVEDVTTVQVPTLLEH